MAFMIPLTLDTLKQATQSERAVFALLANELPASCVVRYMAWMGGHDQHPSFVAVDPARGVWVVQVEDWKADSIVSVEENEFVIRDASASEYVQSRQNPERKCNSYLEKARELLSNRDVLKGSATGRLRVPLQYCVALPNISRKDFLERNLQKVIDPDHVLLGDHLEGNIAALELYDKLLPPLLRPLNEVQLDAIATELFPDTVIPHIRPGFVPVEDEVILPTEAGPETYRLSLYQEQVAKSIREGPYLLRGVAGTGKTLIMLYRAKMLAYTQPDISILILCWNISLATYMRQVYAKLRYPNSRQVEIVHFLKFAADLFRSHGKHYGWSDNRYAWEDPDFDYLLQSLTIADHERYDVILVDEAQDFKPEWIKFLYDKMLRGAPNQRSLLVAGDDAQNIYRRGQMRLKNLGIPFRETQVLKTVYRNSARVWFFAGFLLGGEAAIADDPNSLRFSIKTGYDPELIECRDLTAQIDFVVKRVQALRHQGYDYNNMLVIYKQKEIEGFRLVERLCERLQRAGIPYQWITEDRQAKQEFEWSASTVKISTVHSAKGMDCPAVIVIGAEAFAHGDAKMTYVALTRARESLTILHTGREGIVPRLYDCLQEYQRHLPAIEALERLGID